MCVSVSVCVCSYSEVYSMSARTLRCLCSMPARTIPWSGCCCKECWGAMAYVTFEWLVTSPDLFEAGGSDGLCDFWMTGDFS